MMSRVDQLAELLFIKFQKELPHADVKVSASRASLSKQNFEQRLNRFYAEAREERKKHRLWVFSWARVLLKLQQRLLLAGYPPELVSKLLLAMIFTSHNAN
jgi:hypothetical protein